MSPTINPNSPQIADPIYEFSANNLTKVNGEGYSPQELARLCQSIRRLDFKEMPLKGQELVRFDHLNIELLKAPTYGSPFAARILGPVRSALSSMGMTGAADAVVGTLGADLGALSAGTVAGGVGIAAAVGVGIGIGINYTPKLWGGREVGDSIAQGIEAAVGGKASPTTISVLDRMGFGGWNVFTRSWGF